MRNLKFTSTFALAVLLCAASVALGTIKWEQPPDPTTSGLHSFAYLDGFVKIADDFLCEGGNIVKIRWYGNYENNNMAGGIGAFHLSLHNCDQQAMPWHLPLDPELIPPSGPAPFAQCNETDTGLTNNIGDKIYSYEYTLPVPYPQVEGTWYWLDVMALPSDVTDYPIWRWQEAQRAEAPAGPLGHAPAAESSNSTPWSSIVWPPVTDLGERYSDMAFAIISEEETNEGREYGDAPEGANAVAYPSSGQIGNFPTCKTIGPLSSYIEHNNFGAYFGALVDFESDGNAGACPTAACFPPYDQDECFDPVGGNNSDPGLMMPVSFTIDSTGTTVVSCPQCTGTSLGQTCTMAVWGTNVDIWINNTMPSDTTGYVNVLIDWNQDGVWSGSSVCPPAGTSVPEWVLVDHQVGNPYNGSLSALSPPPFVIGPNSGYVWARFTITEVPLGTVPGGLGITDWDGSGIFEDGESEDYLLRIDPVTQTVDWGDAPDPSYPTLAVNNGANHTIDLTMPWLGGQGDAPDAEPDGQPDTAAMGDDNDTIYGPPVNDDENGVAFLPLLSGTTVNVPVTVFDPSGAGGGGVVEIWIDFDISGSWEAAELAYSGFLGSGTTSVGIPVPTGLTSGTSFARCRISSAGIGRVTGNAPDGEVEDYKVLIEAEIPPDEMDFGDAPEAVGGLFNYPTMLSPQDGARHVIVAGGPYFDDGSGTDVPDAEADGQQDPQALGDDNDADGDDEDGVSIPTLIIGQTATITFDVGGPGGGVEAFIDWNADGDWADAGEALPPASYATGPASMTVNVPATAVAGLSFARFRISNAGPFPMTDTGPAWDGEVEDHEVTIEAEPVDVNLMPKFRQLPQDGPDYFGHDELSTMYLSFEGTIEQPIPSGYEGCYMADDFADNRDTPVIRLKWWGSYLEDVYEGPNVNTFLIVFETDVPAGVDTPYSHPGTVILQQEVTLGSDPLALSPGQFSEILVSPGGPPCGEDLYEYEAYLEIPFYQEAHTVYWVKIVAIMDVGPPNWLTLKAVAKQLPGGLCELLNMPWQVILDMTGVSVPRWGWHNRDYTVRNPYASGRVTPGEFLDGTIMDPASGIDLEIWHFQDDAVSGDITVDMAGEIYQPTYIDEYYKWVWPLCGIDAIDVDGPMGIENHSKDLAFELLTTECFPSTHPDYAMWTASWVGRPECWCYRYQCVGDADGAFIGKDKDGGRIWVSADDLAIFALGWQKVETDPYFPTFICADYNHAFIGKDKAGARIHVSADDLAIFAAGWQVADTVGSSFEPGTQPCPGTVDP